MKIKKLDETGWYPIGLSVESQVRDDAPSGCAIVAYAFGYRLLDACNMIGLLAAGLLLPIFARQIKLKAIYYSKRHNYV